MNNINYSNIPIQFVSDFSQKITQYHLDICIRYFLIEKIEGCENKSQVFRDLEAEGFEIKYNGETYKVFKSRNWLKFIYQNTKKQMK